MMSVDPVLGEVNVCQLLLTATHTGLSILTMGGMIENDGHWGSLTEPASVTETSVDLTVGDADMAWQGQTVIKEPPWVRTDIQYTQICTVNTYNMWC